MARAAPSSAVLALALSACTSTHAAHDLDLGRAGVARQSTPAAAPSIVAAIDLGRAAADHLQRRR